MLKIWHEVRWRIRIVRVGRAVKNQGLEMHLIHVDTVREEDALRGTRIWLVIAANLYEAMSLIPTGYCPKAAEVRAGEVSGPGRVIGWLGPPIALTVQPAGAEGGRTPWGGS